MTKQQEAMVKKAEIAIECVKDWIANPIRDEDRGLPRNLAAAIWLLDEISKELQEP